MAAELYEVCEYAEVGLLVTVKVRNRYGFSNISRMIYSHHT